MYEHIDGARYVGDWNEDRQDGYGVGTWPDSARYDGNYYMVYEGQSMHELSGISFCIYLH